MVRGAAYGIRTRAPGSPCLPSLRGRQIGTRPVWEDKSTDLTHRQASASHCKSHIRIQSPLRCLMKANAWRILKGLINVHHFILYPLNNVYHNEESCRPVYNGFVLAGVTNIEPLSHSVTRGETTYYITSLQNTYPHEFDCSGVQW